MIRNLRTARFQFSMITAPFTEELWSCQGASTNLHSGANQPDTLPSITLISAPTLVLLDILKLSQKPWMSFISISMG